MPKLYACIITDDVKQRRETLLSIAGQFSPSIKVLEDGVLFDVSGLERLVGAKKRVEQKVTNELKRHKLPARVVVADTVDTAVLLARQGCENTFEQLPLIDLNIEQDTLNVFEDLGLRHVKDLLAIPHEDLIARYGRSFQKVIDVAEQKGTSLLTPNIKQNKVSWNFNLDQPVENFEQLIFVLNHGLERLFAQVAYCGFSCEHLDLSFDLKNRSKRSYEIKISFPTLERGFWLKLINLRVALDPPESDIVAVEVIANFTKARTDQRGLYAASRPEPESLLLTISKLKKLVGEDKVGVPVLLNQRLAEPFALDADAIPHGKKDSSRPEGKAVVALHYFHPPLRAEVVTAGRQLIYLRTQDLSGRILNSSGVWKSNSRWWDKPWRTKEWDVEVENCGVYRVCKSGEAWFLTGEYD